MIVDVPGLEDFLRSLCNETRFALDTEADSLHCYQEKLCLIQVSIPGQDVLIDPLMGFSLEAFFKAFEGRQIILHGADYDLRLLNKAGLGSNYSIFDTMIAARLIGTKEFNYAALIQQYFGVALTKSSQKANWALRPLSAKMEEYAKNDTRYLLELADFLEQKLRELNRWEWFRQSCEKAVLSAKNIRQKDPEQTWRLAGSGKFSPRGLAVLKHLWHWRENEARTMDRPPFYILKNDDLLLAARHVEEGMPVNFQNLTGGRKIRFTEALETALKLPLSECPQPLPRLKYKPTEEEERRFARYKTVRDKFATEQELDSSLIASKATLEAIAKNPETASEKLLPWQLEILAPALS